MLLCQQVAERDAGLTRAREAQEDRVLEVMRIMTAGQWRTGVSHVELAQKHGVSPSTVKNWAAEASRLIKLSMGDGEEVRARIASMLENFASVAMAREGYTMGGDAYPNPDVKAATAAVKTLAEVLGLITQKHEHAVVVANYEQMPRASKAQWLREKAAVMLAEADRLESVEVDAGSMR